LDRDKVGRKWQTSTGCPQSLSSFGKSFGRAVNILSWEGSDPIQSTGYSKGDEIKQKPMSVFKVFTYQSSHFDYDTIRAGAGLVGFLRPEVIP
jgi:hypothetical protein